MMHKRTRSAAVHCSEEGHRAVTRPRAIVLMLGLAVCALAVFWKVHNYPFILLDDGPNLHENPVVSGGLTPSGLLWAFKTVPPSYWQPLSLISHMAAVTLFGLDAGAHHLVNVALHVLNTLILFHLLYVMTKATGRSFLVAALFAVHPLHVQPVAWISSRTDLLSGTFFLLALASHFRYAKQPSVLRFCLTAALFAAGLMSKPIVIMLPLVLFLIDFWPLRRISDVCGGTADSGTLPSSSLARLVIEKVPLVIIAVVAAAATILAEGNGGALSTLEDYSAWTRLRAVPYNYARSLWRSFIPVRLEFYPVHPGPHLPLWETAMSILLIAAVTAAAVRRAKRHPYLLFGWTWFLVTLLPVVGFIQIGDDGLADRYLYLPLIGPCVATVWGLGELASLRRYRAVIGAAAGAAIVFAAGAMSSFQLRYWNSSTVLFSRDVELNPGNYLSRNNLALALKQEGRSEEAIPFMLEAIRLQPKRPFLLSNLGAILSDIGRHDEAIGYLRHARVRFPSNVDIRYNLALGYYKAGRFSEATVELLGILELDPNQWEAVVLLQHIGRSPPKGKEMTSPPPQAR